MNIPLLGDSRPFIGSNNLIIYFRNIYLIWYKGFSKIILEQIYTLVTCGSMCILFTLFFPFMIIPCIIFFIFQCLYTIKYIFTIKELQKLDIYSESWEETIFNIIDLQNSHQFCRIKPILSQNDVKEYILFYDKYLSSMIKNRVIPFPNLIHFKIYHYVIIDYFLPCGRKQDRSDHSIKNRFISFSLMYIVLFPISFLMIFWHLMKYFELFHGSIKEYEWSNYAIYYYREKDEYYHETMTRLNHLNENAYNLVHSNNKPITLMIVRIISFISGNIMFYLTTMILFENDTYLVRWIGLFGIIIGFSQKWLSTRIDDVRDDVVILSSHLDDYDITKEKFSKIYFNNLNIVIQEIISFFQTIWYFLWIYPKHSIRLKQFFNETVVYYPVGDIKS